MREARVLAAPRRHVMPRRQRHLVERHRAGVAGGFHDAAVSSAQCEPRHAGQGVTALEGTADHRQHALAIVQYDRRRPRDEERLRIRRRSVATDQDRHLRRERPHVPHDIEYLVGLECMHGRDADERRPRCTHLSCERTGEAEVGDRHAVAARLEGRCDVFHAERFDAKERTEAEALVRGHGTKQQHMHR